MENDILDTQLKNAIDFINKELNPICIYLLGSASRDELREDSDVDIAFLANENIDKYKVFLLAQELYDIFNRDVDLIDLRNSSTVFKVQVVGNGRVIYCNDNIKRQYFEMRTLKEYALLNEEREVIFKSIKDRGNIYG